MVTQPAPIDSHPDSAGITSAIDVSTLQQFWKVSANGTWHLSESAETAYQEVLEKLSDYIGPQNLLGKAAIIETVQHLPEIVHSVDDEADWRQSFESYASTILESLFATHKSLQEEGQKFAVFGPSLDAKGHAIPTFGLYLANGDGLRTVVPRHEVDVIEHDILCNVGAHTTKGIDLRSGRLFTEPIAKDHADMPLATVLKVDEFDPALTHALAIGEDTIDRIADQLMGMYPNFTGLKYTTLRQQLLEAA